MTLHERTEPCAACGDKITRGEGFATTLRVTRAGASITRRVVMCSRHEHDTRTRALTEQLAELEAAMGVH